MQTSIIVIVRLRCIGNSLQYFTRVRQATGPARAYIYQRGALEQMSKVFLNAKVEGGSQSWQSIYSFNDVYSAAHVCFSGQFIKCWNKTASVTPNERSFVEGPRSRTVHVLYPTAGMQEVVCR